MKADEESRRGAGLEALRFVGLFLVLLTGFEILFFAVLVDTTAFARHLELIAYLAASLLRGLGYPVDQEGSLLRTGSEAFEVMQECDATHPMAFVVCAALAYPGRIRWSRLALGLLAISAGNVVRVATIVIAHPTAPDLADFLHLELWPMVLLLLAMAVFVLSVRRPTASGARHA